MKEKLTKKHIRADIFQKIRSIYALLTTQEQIHNNYPNFFQNFEKSCHDRELKILDQALIDAILNSMATLIDYYCIYCMMNIGIDDELIRKVQYSAIGKRFLIRNIKIKKGERDIFPLGIFEEKYKEWLSETCKVDAREVIPQDYWIGYLADAISAILKKYGISTSKEKFNVDPKNNHLIFDKRISYYHHYMKFLYCNPACNTGVKYNIYIDLNNYLKHNSIPRVMHKIEKFEAPEEYRIYYFFEIANCKSIFLKDGFLRDILEMDFDCLHENLKFKATHGIHELCTLEKQWEILSIISIDKNNGFISKDGGTLSFFLDQVLIEKTKKSIFIESGSSLKLVLRELKENICGNLRLNLKPV